MLYNVKLEEKKNGHKWETVSCITNQILVYDSLCSDLLAKIEKNKKTVKKIVKSGKQLIVYYDKQNRGIYNTDYSFVQSSIK